MILKVCSINTDKAAIFNPGANIKTFKDLAMVFRDICEENELPPTYYSFQIYDKTRNKICWFQAADEKGKLNSTDLEGETKLQDLQTVFGCLLINVWNGIGEKDFIDILRRDRNSSELKDGWTLEFLKFAKDPILSDANAAKVERRVFKFFGINETEMKPEAKLDKKTELLP